MSFKRFLPLLLVIALITNVAHARGPAPDAVGPQLSWKLGNLRGLKLRRGTAVDFLLQYAVLVPAGTAASYSVNIDICKWVPVAGNVPDTIESCDSTEEILVSSLTEAEPGSLYEGGLRYGYDPSNLQYRRVNRFSFTLNLRQIDSADPDRIIAKQEFNDLIFAGVKMSSNAVSTLSGQTSLEFDPVSERMAGSSRHSSGDFSNVCRRQQVAFPKVVHGRLASFPARRLLEAGNYKFG